jgi:hypothetical protein
MPAAGTQPPDIRSLSAAAALFTTAPIAASSYVLVRQLGSDPPMIAGRQRRS